MIRLEIVNAVWEYMKEHTMTETIDYMASLVRNRDLAKLWMAIVIKFSYDNFIIQNPTFDDLKNHALSVADRFDAVRFTQMLEQYVSSSPELLTAISLLQTTGKSINELLTELQNELNNLPIVQTSPDYPPEVNEAIEFYNETMFGATQNELEQQINALNLAKQLITTIGVS